MEKWFFWLRLIGDRKIDQRVVVSYGVLHPLDHSGITKRLIPQSNEGWGLRDGNVPRIRARRSLPTPDFPNAPPLKDANIRNWFGTLAPAGMLLLRAPGR